MPPSLSEKVIVITGASSGIGRATAIAAGRQGASLALLARNERALRDVAAEIDQSGGRALPLVTDVAERNQVERAAAMALETLGRIDVWINNAGVYAVGPVDALTAEEIERVMRVNYLGTVYGAKVVLPHFIERERGTLINVSSVVGTRAAPWVSAYAASKHAVKGFTESLQLEMARDHPDIDVVQILPASMNTPLFVHALARMGSKPRPFPPVYDPQLVADAILDAIEHPKRDVFVGTGRSLAALEGLAPAMLDRAMLTKGAAFRAQRTDQSDDDRNNLFAPMADETYAVHGEWMDKMRTRSMGTRLVERHPVAAKIVIGAGIAAATLLVRRQRG